jgi:hypothetical protein
MTNFYPGGYIFYTLDGSTPNPFSATYFGALTLSKSVTLRTLAYSVDFLQAAYSDPISIQIQPSFSLGVSTPGGGSFTISPSNSLYLSNAVVTVTATPSNGWAFLQWQGDLGGSSRTNTVLMTHSKSMQAIFGTVVTNSAGGGGSVVFDPPGTVFPYGFNLQATAVPQSGNVFVLWGNSVSGNTNPLSYVVTNPNPGISALFTSIASGQSSLSAIPVGHGKVSVSPRANYYVNGSVVSISASPDAGKSFLGWSGNASGTQNPLSVTMNQSKVIYANFTTNQSLVLKLGNGYGTSEGVIVDLTAELGAHYRLDGSTNFVVWTTLYDLTNSVGTIHYLDASVTNLPKKFYRAVLLP